MDFWALPKPKDSLKNAFMAYNDSLLAGTGFVAWKEFNHPVLGKVEIGGKVPYADMLPLPGQVDSLLSGQVPWIYELAGHIPSLAIEEVKVESQGAGVYRVSAWIRNTASFSFPLAIGQRTRIPPPAIITLTGKNITLISGKERTPLEALNGNENRKFTWLIAAKAAVGLKLAVTPVNAYGSEKTITIGGN
jgi:hypothetical protein